MSRPSVTPPFPLRPTQWGVAALNKLMGRQPAVQQLLAAHAGRTFHVTAGPVALSLTIGHDGILTPADPHIVPDVELTVDVGLLLRSGWTPGKDVPDLPGMVHVSGDAAMAQTLSTLARQWRPELEDILADWVGDIAAVQLMQGARSVFRGVLGAASKLTENMVEFLAYESRDLTPVPVMHALHTQLLQHQQKLIQLSQSATTLANRLQTLERKLSQVSRGDATNGGVQA